MTPLAVDPVLAVSVISALGVVAAAVLAYFGGRFAVRQARRASTEDRDAVWNAGYRAAAEPHLYWDLAIVAALRQLQDEHNRLLEAQGKPPKEFKEIPDPPPLFPKPPSK